MSIIARHFGTIRESTNVGDKFWENTAHRYFDIMSLHLRQWTVLSTIDWERTACGIISMKEMDSKFEEQKKVVEFLTQKQGYRGLKSQEITGYLWFRHPVVDRIYRG